MDETIIDDNTSVVENNKKHKWFFSLFSGELYELVEEDWKSIDAFQIPLIEKPSKKCKKCYDRMHIGYNLTTKHYDICPKCLRKYGDFNFIVQQKHERYAQQERDLIKKTK